MSETVTGFTLLARTNIGSLIVPNSLDGEHYRGERRENAQAPAPPACDVGPPVHAQVDPAEADCPGEQRCSGDERHAAREPAPHTRRDDRERDVDGGVGGVAA